MPRRPAELCLNDGTPLDEYEPGLFVCPSCGVAFPLAYLTARRSLFTTGTWD